MDPGEFNVLQPGTYNAASRLLEELSAMKSQLAELQAMLASRDAELAEIREENNNLKEVISNNGAASPRRRKLKKVNDQPAVSSPAVGQPTSISTTFSNVGQNGSSYVTNKKMGHPKKKIIQTLDTDIKTVRSSIKNANCKGFSLKQTNVKAPIKITIDTHEEIPAIRKALINSSISFHEFKLPNEKQQAFVIRGLVGVTDDELPAVFQELVSAGITSEAKLSLLVTGHMKANPGLGHNTLLKLIVPPDFDAQVLLKIKFLDHVAVTFEKLKSKSVVQCKNCQRFGHSAGGCQHSHRCVKCGNNHLRDGCPRTSNKSIKLVCCNCGGEHTANNLTVCQFFQKNFKQQAFPAKQPTSTSNSSPALVTGMNTNKTNNARFKTYASAAAAGAPAKNSSSANVSSAAINLADISRKLDLIMQTVSRHETLLQQLGVHE